MGKRVTAVCYYRCMLPAMELGSDWVGIGGLPPKFSVETGIVKGSTQKPELLGGDYDIVVVQQPHGPEWVELIGKMQEHGIRVLYEIDDYLHAIRHMPDHTSADYYTPQRLQLHEEAMEMADGIIVSTKWLKTKYQRYNKTVFVCRNGIDLRRYRLEKPDRGDQVNIGWAGATGHLKAIEPWLPYVNRIMQLREKTSFVSIGQPFADGFKKGGWGNRALSVPFAAIEQYPAAMTLLDIALAPSGNTRFHRGKSDLRWVEASALAIPVIASPTVYSEIEQGKTGFLASSPEQMTEHLLRLVDDPALRKEVGEAARAYIEEHRTMRVVKGDWERAFERILQE